MARMAGNLMNDQQFEDVFVDELHLGNAADILGDFFDSTSNEDGSFRDRSRIPRPSSIDSLSAARLQLLPLQATGYWSHMIHRTSAQWAAQCFAEMWQIKIVGRWCDNTTQ
jgi:hypothetical protein